MMGTTLCDEQHLNLRVADETHRKTYGSLVEASYKKRFERERLSAATKQLEPQETLSDEFCAPRTNFA